MTSEVRQHAYKLLQDEASLSAADCQFYEEEVRQWIDERRTFTAYEISRSVNGKLIVAGKAWLRHQLTGKAVHLLVSMYAEAAGYKSELVDLGSGRRPRLYYPDDVGRQEWMEANAGKPPTEWPIEVNTNTKEVKIKGKTYVFSDEEDLLVLDALNTARGGPVSRNMMRKAYPLLKDDEHLERRIEKIQETYSVFKDLIQVHPTRSGYCFDVSKLP